MEDTTDIDNQFTRLTHTQTEQAYNEPSNLKSPVGRKRGHNSLVVDTNKSSRKTSKENRELRIRVQHCNFNKVAGKTAGVMISDEKNPKHDELEVSDFDISHLIEKGRQVRAGAHRTQSMITN